MQATFSLRSDGKRQVKFSAALAKQFYAGMKIECENHMSIPCGYCLGCRLEKSRQWAIRCVHEAKMHTKNCFLTLTYAPEHLPHRSSLDKKVISDFNKRLRDYAIPKHLKSRKNRDLRRFWVKNNPVRFFYCGEYGDEKGRPHYHSLVFNFDFEDKKYWKTVRGKRYYTSEKLQQLWPFGFSTIGEVEFDSAAYVARYSLKKVYGTKALDHYRRVDAETGEEYFLQPEFAKPSLKPGIGANWFHKFVDTDVIPTDSVISRGRPCKIPRYYDVLWERKDPESFLKAKELRLQKAKEVDDNATYARLQTRMKCQEARIKNLIRQME